MLTIGKEGLEAVFESIPEGIVVVNGKGEVVMANQTARASLGLEPHTSIGLSQLVWALKTIGVEELLLHGEEDKAQEVEIGSPKTILEIRQCFLASRLEKASGFILLMRDVTARKELDQMKEDFIHTLAHEMRTPLTILQGAIENLCDGIAGAVTPQQQKVLKIADSNLKRLTRTIVDLLDLSRLELGRMPFKLKEVAPSVLLRESNKNFEEKAKEKGIELKIEIPVPLPLIAADAALVLQVLNHLMLNAFRYAKRRIILRAIPMNHSFVPVVQFSVIDDGPGIPFRDLKQLFNKFVQLAPLEEGGHAGMGLGLAISKELIEGMKGKIWVESTPGTGNQFHFILPEYNQELLQKEKPSALREKKRGTGGEKPVPQKPLP